MDITSFICGIVGLLGIVYSFFAINMLKEYSINNSINIISFNSKLFLILLFIPFLLSLLAIIFGFISGIKIKRFSLTGKILGFIGMFLIIICTILSAMNNNEKRHIMIYRPGTPIYSYFTEIGIVETTTKDNFIAKVKIVIAYDKDDSALSLELTSRKDELENFIKSYFNNKIVSELAPENEYKLKHDIKEIINNNILENVKISQIIFDKLDIVYPY